MNELTRTIEVVESAYEVRGVREEGPTKTGKVRTIGLPSFLAEEIKGAPRRRRHLERNRSDLRRSARSGIAGELDHRLGERARRRRRAALRSVRPHDAVTCADGSLVGLLVGVLVGFDA